MTTAIVKEKIPHSIKSDLKEARSFTLSSSIFPMLNSKTLGIFFSKAIRDIELIFYFLPQTTL